GDDAFHVFGTNVAGLTLNGGNGNDSYVFHLPASGDPDIIATVTDTGNPTEISNTILVIGTDQADNIKITNQTITLDAAQATPKQVLTYTSPAADDNLLSIKVQTSGGDDAVTVASTSATVPVRVEIGDGNDVVKVGTGLLSGIQEEYRPGSAS